MSRETKSVITSALFEAAFVVLGVALAYLANEWRQEKAGESRVEAALAGIIRELEANQEAVAEARDYHRYLFETITQRHDRDTPLSIREFHRGFISPAEVLTTAWTTAAQTATLEKMSYDQVLTLSAAYNKLSGYKDQSRASGQIIYETLFKSGHEGFLKNADNHAMIVQTFIYREEQLIDTLDETLDVLSTEFEPE